MGDIRVAWWNLQNFFDTDDDPISKDFEYTVAEGWTEAVFAAKKTNLAGALSAMHNGAGPKLLAVCEIEGDDLLEELVAAMGNPNLKVVKDPGGTSDLRGIDVAMAYDNRKLKVVDKSSHVLHLRYATRDLFEVTFQVKPNGPKFVVLAGHWPSRWRGRYRTEPLRIAVAEHVAFLIRDHVRFTAEAYEQLRTTNDLAAVQKRWETPVMVIGDLNDEPSDRSIVEHLMASSEIHRVRGRTNDIDGFEDETADYRGDTTFVYNATWQFLPPENTGTYFISSNRQGVEFANRYQVLDQIIVTRGFLTGDHGISLDTDSVAIFDDEVVATKKSKRPRAFVKKTKKGTSDHLPVTAVLNYTE